MTNLQPSLDILKSMLEDTDQQIVGKIEHITAKEKELNSHKAGLRFLQERSASLSAAVAFVEAGIQNQALGVKIEIGEENPNG